MPEEGIASLGAGVTAGEPPETGSRNQWNPLSELYEL